MARIEAIRVAQDAEYAASLSDADWHQLSLDPDWQQLVAEQSEMVAGVIATHGHKLPSFSAAASARPTQPEAPRTAFKIAGTDVARMQGIGIVTNLGQYTENMRMPGMLFMRTLRSRYPHAKITSVDISKAQKLPGVKAVLHRGNLPAEYADVFLGAANPTRFLFNEEVFEVGSPIAVVAAESEHVADEALRQIDVQYQVLPAALDFLEAMKATTPKQFTSNLDGTTIAVTPPLVRGDPTNTRADAVVDVIAHKPVEQHVALEVTNGLFWWDNDKLNAVYTSQWPHGVRANLSTALKIPQNKVRVVQPGYVGSGYGYRSGIDLAEVHAAILSKLTARPIKMNYTRYEDFVTRTHRNEFRDEMKLGVNRDGKIQFGQFKVIANVGAQRAGAANGAWFNMQNLYVIPNLKLEAVDVMTNSFKSGPYRCVSHPNGTFALETTMEKAAYAIGMDPIAFRLANLNEVGNPDTKAPFSNPGIRDCSTAVRDQIGWQQKWHAPKANQVRPGVYHGIGMAAHACSHGAGGNPASGQVIINSDGTVQCISANNDIGDGQRTQMMMIVAEALGVPLTSVTITAFVDTDLTTDASGNFGCQQSHQPVRGAAADRRGRGHGDRVRDHRGAPHRQVNRAPAQPESARLQAAQHQGCSAGGRDHDREAQGVRRLWSPRHRRAADGTPRADSRQRRLQRRRRLGDGYADDSREADRGTEELGGNAMRGFELYEATTVSQAVDLLRQNSSRSAKVIGGGSDLVGGMMKDWVSGPGLPIPEVLIDLTTIKDLATISSTNDGATIGAAVTLTDVIEHEDLQKKFPLLVAAAQSVASPLIRNFGTIGGNVNQRPRCWFFRGEDFNCYKKGGDFCYAVTGDNRYHAIIGGELCYIVHPSDTATALLALNASAKITGVNGDKTVAFDSYFTGPREDVLRENVLKPGEFVTHITIPNPAGGTKMAWNKLKDRQVCDFALTSVAVAFTVDGPNWKDGRITLGGVSPVPYRAKVVEDALKGKDIKATIKQAAAQIRTVTRPMSLNAYKVDLAQGLIERTVLDALGQ